MKVNTDAKDRFGTQCLIFEGAKSVDAIYEFLWNNFQGYKFAIVLDTTCDEYDTPKKVFVYFFDCIFDEVVSYLGIGEAKKQLERLENR